MKSYGHIFFCSTKHFRLKMIKRLFLILIFCQIAPAVRILRAPIFPEGNAPNSSFANLKNPTIFITEEFSICFWVLVNFEYHAEVLSRNENGGVIITFLSHGNYIEVDSYSIRFEFPRNFRFIPEKWMFLCLTSNKRLKVYLNSELIFEKEIDNVTEGLRLPKDFLKYLQIGKASAFAGELSELNIWSKVLTDDKINDLYECKDITDVPDILD